MPRPNAEEVNKALNILALEFAAIPGVDVTIHIRETQVEAVPAPTEAELLAELLDRMTPDTLIRMYADLIDGTCDPIGEALAERITNAGTAIVGEHAWETARDYVMADALEAALNILANA